MSLLDKASLIVTPNAYKESKLYSVVPSDGTGDMTVVRATTATRVNSSGLIEVVPRNLVAYSNDFTNAVWTKTNSTIESNSIISPNGTQTASKLNVLGVTYSGLYHIGNSQSNKYTMSLYAKKGNKDWLYFVDLSGSSVIAWFNISNGTLGTVTNGTASITDVGNGWYRCTYSNTNNISNSYFQIGLSDANNSNTPSSSGFSYIWGIQLDLGTTATEYFPTTTRLNIPRIDYTNGSCPSLLVEPQRTNLLTYSEALTPNYTFNQCSITSNQISPNGTNNAKRITNGATATDVYFEQSVGITLNSYTWSAFVKKGTDNSATIKPVHVGIGGDVSLMTFTFATETIVTSGAITTSGFTKLTNGWYRIFCTVPITLAVISLRGRFGNSNTANVYNEWYGVQLEVGSYPTSYIPTVASTVTRNADVISKTGISSLIGTTYTVYGEIINEGIHNARHLALKLPTGGNYDDVVFIVQYFNGLQATANNSTSTAQFTINSGSYSIGQTLKYALRCEQNNVAFYINGVQIGVDTLCTIPAVSTLYIGNYVDLQLGSKIKSTIIFPSALTNTELAQLTTL